MHPICLFFNTRIEVLERTPNTFLHLPESFHAKKSIAYKCQAIGDLALTPVRYLFYGRTVRIEQRRGEVSAVDHVDSFYPGVKTHESGMSCRLESGELRSGEINCLRTVLAIVLLIPGCFCALFFKLPFYFCDELKKDREVTQIHFTPVEIEVGKEIPITNIQELNAALGEQVCKASPYYPIVKSLTIFGKQLKLQYDPEDPLLLLLLSPVIQAINPKEFIFIETELDELTKKALFFNRK
jgi:hypothetical protein